MSAEQHIARLKRVADEYWTPTDLQQSIAWAVTRILALETEVDQLRVLTRLEAERIAAQSELLSKRAAKDSQ